MNKRFYVLAESIKFVKEYPLNQRDIPVHFKVTKMLNNSQNALFQKGWFKKTLENLTLKPEIFKTLKLQYPASVLKSGRPLEKEHPLVDYTPPDYITLLFTDLGILTPAAVSDELIKLYL